MKPAKEAGGCGERRVASGQRLGSGVLVGHDDDEVVQLDEKWM